MRVANITGSKLRACRMLSWKASVLVKPAVAGSESNSGNLITPGSSRTRFSAELALESGSYGVCGIAFSNLGEFSAIGVDLCRLNQVFHILKINASLKTVPAAERV